VRERILGVDQRIEKLVIVRCRQIEELPDGLLLGSGVLPPLPFQGKHLLLPLAQRRVPQGKVSQQRAALFGLRQVFPSWFSHGTLLCWIGVKVSPPCYG
jgi:hypothetical protein